MRGTASSYWIYQLQSPVVTRCRGGRKLLPGRHAKVALGTAAMAAAGFFYLLVEDNRTSSLAGSTPPWGRPLRGLPADGDFHMTDWHAIAHLQPSQCPHKRVGEIHCL